MPRRASTPYCPNLPVIMEQEDITIIEEETARHFSIALRDRLSSALGADDAACKLLLEEFLKWFGTSAVEITPLENTGIYDMRKADGVTTQLIAIAGSSVGTTLANASRGVFERVIEIIDGHDFLSASTEVTLLLLLDQSITVVYYNPQDERMISPFPSSDRSKPHAERALAHRVKPLLKGPQLYDYARDEDDSDEDDILEDVRDGSGIFLDLKDWENHLAVRECFLFVFYPQILHRYV